MKINVFSVAGEALNFGARRMETIMRTAWLPVALLLILDGAAVFSVLSIENGRLITFADLAQGGSFQRASAAAGEILAVRALGGDLRFIALALAWIGLQAALVASFMAPLIRFAGLGERPQAGVLHLPFGGDQLRFLGAQAVGAFVMFGLILTPIVTGFLFIGAQIEAAVDTLYFDFPAADSLHTIQIAPAIEVLSARGELWFYAYGMWFGLAAIVFFVAWQILTRHFHALGRGVRGPGGYLMRAAFVFAVLAVLIYGYTRFATNNLAAGVADISTAMSALFGAVAILLLYANVRLLAYPGFAVCRRSMAFSPALSVSRGWNLLRLAAVAICIGVGIWFVQFVIEKLLFGWLGAAMYSLFQAGDSLDRLVNNGDGGDRIRDFFVWLWTSLAIIYKFFWMFFTYGVAAGLYGRLYRESVRVDAPAAAGDA